MKITRLAFFPLGMNVDSSSLFPFCTSTHHPSPERSWLGTVNMDYVGMMKKKWIGWWASPQENSFMYLVQTLENTSLYELPQIK